MSDTSDTSSANGRATSRLYQQAKGRQLLQQRQENNKENGARCGGGGGGGAGDRRARHRARSKELAGERAGDAGTRLHEQGKAAQERKAAQALEAERRRAEAERAGGPAVPRSTPSPRSSRRTARARSLTGCTSTRASASGGSRPRRWTRSGRRRRRRGIVSTGSERIAATLPGREDPVQDRLYAEASERREKRHEAAAGYAAGMDDARPAINETSRRLAERAANAGVPLDERLASRTGSCPARPAAVATELTECTLNPTINAKSERLAVQAQTKAWEKGLVNVEDRLIAQAPVHTSPERVEQKPTINPHSVNILLRRGPIEPLQERLRAPLARSVRSSAVGSEVEQCTLAPKVSAGSERILAARGDGRRRESIVDRLQKWGKERQRGDGDASLADRKFRFGPDPSEEKQTAQAAQPRLGPCMMMGTSSFRTGGGRAADAADAATGAAQPPLPPPPPAQALNMKAVVRSRRRRRRRGTWRRRRRRGTWRRRLRGASRRRLRVVAPAVGAAGVRAAARAGALGRPVGQPRRTHPACSARRRAGGAARGLAAVGTTAAAAWERIWCARHCRRRAARKSARGGRRRQRCRLGGVGASRERGRQPAAYAGVTGHQEAPSSSHVVARRKRRQLR